MAGIFILLMLIIGITGQYYCQAETNTITVTVPVDKDRFVYLRTTIVCISGADKVEIK